MDGSATYDTINSLNSDAGFGLALSPVLARHIIISFLWTCFDVLSQPRGYYDALAIAQAGCSSGRGWLPPLEGAAQKAPHRALRRLPLHRRAVGWRRCVSIIAGPSVACKLPRHTPQTRFPTFVQRSSVMAVFSPFLLSECDRLCTSIAIPNHMHRLVVIASGPALCSTLRNVQYPPPEVFFFELREQCVS